MHSSDAVLPFNDQRVGMPDRRTKKMLVISELIRSGEFPLGWTRAYMLKYNKLHSYFSVKGFVFCLRKDMSPAGSDASERAIRKRWTG